ncbi:Enhanced entry protein EnhB [Legionella beliardensis]|uniref:Enhanced entry protein EnhB n=1 Tax=Legionella beliardensis TaxID=91822 RepID=A0A378I530_9GAMM|nr:hypothetical protein [Legionella beliardensis]STX30123.1 Enhanced entry protein EnhB [Legionella beliardensis]
MKFYSAVMLLIINTLAYGQATFPTGCNPISVQGETVLLKTKQPVVFLIYNNAADDLWITHPVSEPSASAGWSSRLETHNWSAFALDQKSFELSCIESKPGHEQQIPCAGILSICKWPALKIPAGTTGTFWAAENMNLQALNAYLGGRGFKLLSAQ